MSTYDSAALQSAATAESIDIEKRTRKALTQYLTVLEEGPSLYSVTSESGAEYCVDTRAGRCTCDDHQYRDVVCKHRRRVAFATGAEAIPADAAAALDVDDQLGDHVDGEVRIAVADGGTIITAGDDGEVIDQDDDRVEGPFPEFDKRGNYTGADYYRCSACGAEAMREQDLDDCCGGAR
jgi:hypothetical protein